MSRHAAEAARLAVRWPIEDLDVRQADLVAQAEADAPDLLFAAGAAQTGAWSFRIETGEQPALIGVCEVEPWPGRPGSGRHA